MDESFSGFTARGGWVAIVEHGERITRALRDEGVPDDRLERWAEWRPKAHERLGEDVEEKTAEQGVTPEEPERWRAEPRRHAGAKENAGMSDDTPTEDGTDDGSGATFHDSVEHTARAADTAGRKALRAAERAVYRTVMRKTAPYYFNDDLLSANIERARDEAGPYVFAVTIKDHDLKERVSERLAKYDDEIERWHVDAEKRTDALEAAEGAEPTEIDSESSAESDVETDSTTT